MPTSTLTTALSSPPTPLPPSIPSSPAPSHAGGSSWTFTQGLILGQASFLVLGLLFVRYVVFSPSEEVDGEGWKARRAERSKRAVLSTTSVPPPPASHLLSKTGYDMATHPPESADWLNVLLASILQGYRNDLLSAGGEEGARTRIEKWLNPDDGKLSWLDPIEVTSLSLGNAFPLLSNARIRPADGQGRIRAEIDVDYSDSVSLALSTSVLINFPRPRFAVLPVSLGVELVSIGGTLSVQLHQPIDERQHLHASLLPDFHLNLKTTSLLGSRAKLQDIPKLEQLILSRLRQGIQDRLVYPSHLSLALPRILSPSVSPTPLLNDIGESAVNAMSDAVISGVGRMVEDLVGDIGDVVPGPSMSVSQADDEEFGFEEDLDLDMDGDGTRGEVDDQPVPVPLVPGGLASSPTRTISSRKIPMPSDFPRAGTPQTSLPAQSLRSRPAAAGSSTTSYRQPPMLATTSSYHPMMPGSMNGSGSASATPSQSQSGFRFRGQFASAPHPTSGVVHRDLGQIGGGGAGAGKDRGVGIGQGMYEERRLGAFNSRAG